MSDGMPVTGVVPLSQMKGDDEEENRLLQEMSKRAQRYLSGFKWCESILDFYFGDGVGGVFAVFFARIKPASPEIDEWLWVIIGDIPPAYLVTDVCCIRSKQWKATSRKCGSGSLPLSAAIHRKKSFQSMFPRHLKRQRSLKIGWTAYNSSCSHSGSLDRWR